MDGCKADKGKEGWLDGCSQVCPHLDGRHLGVAPPAEPWEVLLLVAEAHGSAVSRGSLLYLVAQVVQVWEVVALTGPVHTQTYTR